jgi:hypothetical protein
VRHCTQYKVPTSDQLSSSFVVTSNHKLVIQQLRQVYLIVPQASRTCPVFGATLVMYMLPECHACCLTAQPASNCTLTV